MIKQVNRGEIYLADLDPIKGCEQGGYRPVLIIQNNVGNRYSPTVIVSAITSRLTKRLLPVHVALPKALVKSSICMLEQIRTLDKSRLRELVGKLSDEDMMKVNRAILISLGCK